jgi:hypothetical protein
MACARPHPGKPSDHDERRWRGREKPPRPAAGRCDGGRDFMDRAPCGSPRPRPLPLRRRRGCRNPPEARGHLQGGGTRPRPPRPSPARSGRFRGASRDLRPPDPDDTGNTAVGASDGLCGRGGAAPPHPRHPRRPSRGRRDQPHPRAAIRGPPAGPRDQPQDRRRSAGASEPVRHGLGFRPLGFVPPGMPPSGAASTSNGSPTRGTRPTRTSEG